MVLVGLTALVVVGCAQEPAVEKHEVVALGNEICRSRLAEVDERIDAAPEKEVAEAERHVQDEVVPAYRIMMNELRSLGAPEGEAEYLETLYADAESGVALIEDRPSAALDGELRPFPGIDRRFDNYGLSRCDLASTLAPEAEGNPARTTAKAG